MIDSLQQQMTNDDIMLIFDAKGDYKDRFFVRNNPNHILFGSSRSYRTVAKSWDIFRELKDASGGFDEKESMLPNLMHLQDALNFGRGLGVKVFAGLQSFSRLLVHSESGGRGGLR